jgi:8-oxo-dGTP pyrophosphatase MutT (NUDIX family)
MSPPETTRTLSDHGRTHDPHHDLPCAERGCDVAVAILVDARGWVLLQERDDHAPVSPRQWAFVGGHVEAGEPFADAVVRELAEETGLRLPEGTLRVWYDGDDTPEVKVRPGLWNHWQIWVGRVDLTDEDIVVGEGRQIVFVDPVTIGGLDLSRATAHYLPLFLASEEYAALAR